MELTVKEAIEQGYTKYGFEDRGWQCINDLSDLSTEFMTIDEFDDMVLFEKSSSQPLITASQVSELLADLVCENDSEECGRDDDSVFETMKSIDYSVVVETINKELKQNEYYKLTDIKLIP